MAHRRGSAPKYDAKIGARLRRRRQERGLSQEGLSKLCGISATQLYHYETGQSTVTVGRLVQITEALDIPIAVVFAEEFGDVEYSAHERAINLKLLDAFWSLPAKMQKHLAQTIYSAAEEFNSLD